MRLLALLAALLLGGAVPARAQADSAASPEWVARRFMARDSFPDRARYYMGEMAESYATVPTLGASLPTSARVRVRALERGAETAVYAATVSDTSATTDWYLHLAREGGAWKLAAVRALALPPFFYEMVDSLQSAKNLPDSISSMLPGLRLTISSDSALKAYFAAHARELGELAALVERSPALTRDTDGGAGPVGAIAARLRALHLSSASGDEGEAAGCVLLAIGGMLDNEVGYLHAPAGCQLPKMSPHLFIYLEQVAPGWYLYKTT